MRRSGVSATLKITTGGEMTMKRIKPIGWITVLAVAAMLLAAGRPGFCAEKNIKASLAKVEGSVKVRLTDAGAWQAAISGMRVGAGATIRTEAGGSAFLNWSGNTLKIHPLTEFKVNSLKRDSAAGSQNSDVQINGGKVFARAKQLTGGNSSFNIKTPSAIAGVRGTDFAVDVTGGQTSVAVVDGSVQVEAGGVEVILTDALQTIIPMGEAPMAPTEVPADVMETLQADVEQVAEVETTVIESGVSESEEEATAEEEAAAEEEGEGEGEGEEAAAEGEGEGEEAAAEEGGADETAATEGAATDETAAADATAGEVSDIVADTTDQTLTDQANQDIASQGENIFDGCCVAR